MFSNPRRASPDQPGHVHHQLLQLGLQLLAQLKSPEEQVNIPDYWNFMAMIIFCCGFSSKL